jgi:hypothetical protein
MLSPPTLPKSDLETQEGPPRGAFLRLSLMYFYSGQLMQFYSGVDTDHPITRRGVAALEHRRKDNGRNRTRSVNNPAAGKNSAVAPCSLPNIADLIAYGEITVGVLRPVGCVAVASDGHNALAMLVRRRGETLAQLLTRLDLAIAKALTEDVYTDEINPPSRHF